MSYFAIFFTDSDFLLDWKRLKMAAGSPSDEVQIIFDSNLAKASGYTQNVCRQVPQHQVRHENSFHAIQNYLIGKVKQRLSGCINVFGDCGK
jgi:hypothetical protein